MKKLGVLLSACAVQVTMAQQGTWEFPPFAFGSLALPAIEAIHLVHTYDPNAGTGRIIGIPGTTQRCGQPEGQPPTSDLVRYWTPPPPTSPEGSPGTFEAAPLCRTFMFCEGHCALADGRILNVGGMQTSTGEGS